MIATRIFPDHEAMSQCAAEWLAVRLRERPDALICLAAGETPKRTYQLLADRGVSEPALFERCRLLKLDEWGGIPLDDPATCEQQLLSVLVAPLKLSQRYTAFLSQPADPEQECGRVAAWLKRQGPIDACVLGLGMNGHLGFNEPGEALEPHAHVAKLSDASLAHPMVAESVRRPSYGLTLGMADILRSRDVLLLVSGARKREPLRRLLSGRVTTLFPASFLQLHPRATLFCDREAIPGDDHSNDWATAPCGFPTDGPP